MKSLTIVIVYFDPILSLRFCNPGVAAGQKYGWWYRICVCLWIWLGLAWAATVISASQGLYEAIFHPERQQDDDESGTGENVKVTKEKSRNPPPPAPCFISVFCLYSYFYAEYYTSTLLHKFQCICFLLLFIKIGIFCSQFYSIGRLSIL